MIFVSRTTGGIIGLITVWLLFSCNRTTKLSTIASDAVFTEAEANLIDEGESKMGMRIFTLNNYKDSVLLRMRSHDIPFPTSDTLLEKFTQRLYHTVTDSAHLGVGIAAPQVGILKNIVWVQRFDKTSFPFEVFYNPKILKYSTLKQDCLEGCLSIPNRLDTTRTRSYAILLEHEKPNGEKRVEMIEDFTAVIFQHEIDHLNGILYTDHLEKELKN